MQLQQCQQSLRSAPQQQRRRVGHAAPVVTAHAAPGPASFPSLPGLQGWSAAAKAVDPLRVLQQQQQQQVARPADAVMPAAPPATLASLKFAKHLSTVTNGCAPPAARFEALGWLLYESKRLQAALLGPLNGSSSWQLDMHSPAQLALLEQLYVIGAAVAELGTADGLQPLSTSNGARAIACLDYQQLLQRYLVQHGQLLTEAFWSQLHAHDELQARAIHVATALETRCMVHALLFDRLIECVGTEGANISPGGWPAAGWGGGGSPGPLAAAITNTMINTTQQVSAPVTSATSSANNSSSTSAHSSSAATAPAGNGGGGASLFAWVGQLGAVLLVLCSVAGRLVQIGIAVVSFARDLVMQLLMLRAVTAGSKALRAQQAAALQPAGAGSSTSRPPRAALSALYPSAPAAQPTRQPRRERLEPQQQPLQEQPWRVEAAAAAQSAVTWPVAADHQQQQRHAATADGNARQLLQRIGSKAGALPSALRQLKPRQQLSGLKSALGAGLSVDSSLWIPAAAGSADDW